jgi:hypothetical protein
MAEIIEDIKISILEIVDDLGINFTSFNPKILHNSPGTTGSLTIETNSSSTNALTLSAPNGGLILSAASGIVGITGGLAASSQQITSSGAISLNHLITTFNTTSGAINATLADGEVGQMKILVGETIATGITATVTPTSPLGFTSVAFNLTGGAANLLYVSSGWVLISQRNSVVV